MKHYLKLSSLLMLMVLGSCSAPYKSLRQSPPASTVYRYQPVFDRVLYRCIVDGKFIFKKFHLSGLLFFKQLENGTKRAVFQNELGMTFFDLEWKPDGTFTVKNVIEQLDKEAVIKTLRKDLEMLMMLGMEKESEIVLGQDRGKEELHRLNMREGYAYYTIENNRIVKIEHANNRKVLITVNTRDIATETSMPDTVQFEHHKANFTISLTKIESNVNE